MQTYVHGDVCTCVRRPGLATHFGQKSPARYFSIPAKGINVEID
jgi:hypothetical protein